MSQSFALGFLKTIQNFGKIQCDSMIPSTSFVNHEQNMEIMYPVMTSVDKHGYSNETTCEHCGTIISNNHDAIVSHLQQCTIDVKPIQTMVRRTKEMFVSFFFSVHFELILYFYTSTQG